MISIGAYEAKTHLSDLLERVARGERITITRYGVPIAMLVPVDGDRADFRDTLEEILRFRSGRRLSRAEARDLVEEGRWR